jgi:hypothetical protein
VCAGSRSHRVAVALGTLVRSTALSLALCAVALLFAVRAHGQIIGGEINYTGAFGPISREVPLCLCLYTDAQLTHGVGCLIFRNNPAPYTITLGQGSFYFVAFVDLNDTNELLDPGEPFEIYNDRSAPPGDPVAALSNDMHVDFDFGDENLPATATPTETEPPPPTPSVTPTSPFSPTPTDTAPVPATATSTATAIPPRLAGDCDDDGSIAIAELIRAVGIALGTFDLTACPSIDSDRDGTVRVSELVHAVLAALGSS